MEILTQSNGAQAYVTVTVLQQVNILVEGSGLALRVGDSVELPVQQAHELAERGYVSPVRVERAAEAHAPAVPRRAQRAPERS